MASSLPPPVLGEGAANYGFGAGTGVLVLPFVIGAGFFSRWRALSQARNLSALLAYSVVYDGVEVVHLFHSGLDQAADSVFVTIDGCAVSVEIGDEIRGELVGDEFGGPLRGGSRWDVLELREIGVGGGEQGVVAGAGWWAERIGEAGGVLRALRLF